jgi:hypothetical protein
VDVLEAGIRRRWRSEHDQMKSFHGGKATMAAAPKTPKAPKRHGKVGDIYAKPTPKVSRLKKAKVLSAEERAAFLAERPDLKK